MVWRIISTTRFLGKTHGGICNSEASFCSLQLWNGRSGCKRRQVSLKPAITPTFFSSRKRPKQISLQQTGSLHTHHGTSAKQKRCVCRYHKLQYGAQQGVWTSRFGAQLRESDICPTNGQRSSWFLMEGMGLHLCRLSPWRNGVKTPLSMVAPACFDAAVVCGATQQHVEKTSLCRMVQAANRMPSNTSCMSAFESL